MKQILTIILLSLALFGCGNDDKKQEKALLDEVIKIHDRVMTKDEQIMTNTMKLDTLIKQSKDTSMNVAAITLKSTLESADASMEDWMHKFDAENKGKSHAQIMQYLQDQKKQITAIEKNFNTTIASTTEFIGQMKSK